MLKGIDVSQHQGKINWDVVKGNIDYAILRLGWTGNKNNHTLDTQFERNYAECKRLGIPIGIYVYNYCNSIEKVKSGANWTIERLKGKTLELPIYLDMEDSTIRGLGKTILTNMCIEFNSIIEKAGFWAGVYANKDWFNNYLDKNVLGSRYTCWVAQYSSSCTLTIQNKDMWQYSDCGKVNGINGKVDMNYLYRDLLQEMKRNNINTNLKSIEEVAHEVINRSLGQWR